MMFRIFEAIGQVHWQTMLFSIGVIITVALLKRFRLTHHVYSIITVVVFTLLAFILHETQAVSHFR